MQQKAEKEEIEKRRNDAIACNAPAQKAIDLLKRKMAAKTCDFREMVGVELTSRYILSVVIYSLATRSIEGIGI